MAKVTITFEDVEGKPDELEMGIQADPELPDIDFSNPDDIDLSCLTTAQQATFFALLAVAERSRVTA